MFIINGYDRKTNACSPWTSCSNITLPINISIKFRTTYHKSLFITTLGFCYVNTQLYQWEKRNKQKQLLADVLQNRYSYKFYNIHWNNPGLKSLFAGLQVWNFIKNRLQHRCFSVNIAKFLKTTSFIEHFWWLLLSKLKITTLFSNKGKYIARTLYCMIKKTSWKLHILEVTNCS